MIDYLKDTLKDIFESIKERVNNPFSQKNQKPFAGAFIIAFIFYNWELIFTLFNFENSEYRIDKISFIKYYLLKDSLWFRIGMPTLIALLSIVFYYFFNYISLGITTIFNRKFQALILHFTDRSKNIPRTELEKELKPLEYLRKNNERLSKKVKELSSELEETSQNFNSIQEANITFKEKIQRLEDELMPILLEKTELTIRYAFYGTEERFIEVTKIVRDNLRINESLFASNETFNNDPHFSKLKNLTIEYKINDSVRKLTVPENHWVLYENSELKIVDSPIEVNKLFFKSNLANFMKVFSGKWSYSKEKNNIKTVSIIEFKDDRNGLIDNSDPFTFTVAEFTKDNIQIHKQLTDGGKIIIESLKVKQENIEYFGNDNFDNHITYKRQ